MTRMRVYWIKQTLDEKRSSEYYDVKSVDEAIAVLVKLESEPREKDVHATWYGLEIFKDGKWQEYTNDRGEDINDIRELMNESYLH